MEAAEGSLCSPRRALPTEKKVDSGTSQSKSGSSVDSSNSGQLYVQHGWSLPEDETGPTTRRGLDPMTKVSSLRMYLLISLKDSTLP